MSISYTSRSLGETRYPSLKSVEDMACEILEPTLNQVKDPVMLMQFFAHGKDTLEFSNRLIHRWPQ